MNRRGRICALFLLSFALQGAQKCLAPDAIWRVRSVSDPQISPDGKYIVYVESWNDVMDDVGYSHLRLVPIERGQGRPITGGKGHSTSPRWSPDGRAIAYISDRGGRQAIHVRNLSKSEERVIDPGAEGVSNLAWSPDGAFLAYLAFAASKPTWAPAMPQMPAGAHWAPPPVAVTELRWTFDGIGVLKPGATHIFLAPAAGGPARQISHDPYQHTFYVGEAGLAWARDSRSVLAPAVKARDGWAVYEGNQIYEFPADGGEPKQLTNLKGYGLDVRPSPDGARIAFAGYDWKGHSYHVSKLRVIAAGGGEFREVTTAWDRDVASPVWSPDSKRVYFLSDDGGSVNLYETDLEGHIRQVTRDKQRISAFSIASGSATLVSSTATHAPMLAIVSLNGHPAPRIIADPNGEALSGCILSDAEEVWYPSFDGAKIQGWILKPPEFDSGRHYPVLVSIHGGPHGSYGPSFNPELQAFADHGYVVLYTNPRGSTGYGEAFGNSIQHNWPGDDIRDILAGVDFVLKKGYADADRMGVIGGSGGGLMTAWMIGHTDRFRAAVALYPVTNWFTHVGSGDNGFYIASVYRKGMPWEYPEDYITHSPLFYASRFKTPTLIITGEEDWRTPIAQSQELFRALKERGVETVLVRVPGESHGIRKRPSHKVATLVHAMAWLDKHIDPRPR
jgi:dipeptidyl aminopeptidase/acylaminoacyl peptidase